MAEVRIPIPDRTGAAAEVFTLAAELGVNIANFEVVHLAESNRGVAVVLVDAAAADLFRGGLMARGFKPAVTPLV
jgi:prephenate dehydrogenase